MRLHYVWYVFVFQASSKKLVNDICNQTVASLYNTAMRDETPAKLQDQLSISAHDAKQLSAALEKLLHEAIYHGKNVCETCSREEILDRYRRQFKILFYSHMLSMCKLVSQRPSAAPELSMGRLDQARIRK